MGDATAGPVSDVTSVVDEFHASLSMKLRSFSAFGSREESLVGVYQGDRVRS